MANPVGKVAKVNDDGGLVVNLGSTSGVSVGDRFLVYRLGEEILDPDTGESLGALEMVVGPAKAVHVQEKMSTLVSDQWRRTESRRVVKRTRVQDSTLPLFPQFFRNDDRIIEEEQVPASTHELVPFKLEPKLGDLVRQFPNEP